MCRLLSCLLPNSQYTLFVRRSWPTNTRISLSGTVELRLFSSLGVPLTGDSLFRIWVSGCWLSSFCSTSSSDEATPSFSGWVVGCFIVATSVALSASSSAACISISWVGDASSSTARDSSSSTVFSSSSSSTAPICWTSCTDSCSALSKRMRWIPPWDTSWISISVPSWKSI